MTLPVRYAVRVTASPLSIPGFRAFWIARLTATVGQLMLVVVIGWQVYDIARATMSVTQASLMLGWIGLAQFVPVLGLTLVAGWTADRVDRRVIGRWSLGVTVACAGVLAALTAAHALTLTALFTVAFVLGAARAFAGPALSALAPNLVPRDVLPRAIALSSIAWQAGAIGGPPLGAYLYAVRPEVPYAAAAFLLAAALAAMWLIPPVPRPERSGASPWRMTVEGLAYIRGNPVVLGAISLDLFAVLLGGATAMLPVYARDVLHTGVAGLGPLRAAPALGATLTAIILARRPLERRVGHVMFACVGLFGVATIVFGLSTNLALSLEALAVLGAADMVSVFVRSSLIQLHTPDAMRGRVNAGAGLFVSASNELGEFESGFLASVMGAVPAVVAGGVGAVLVTVAWAGMFPQLRRADRFEAANQI